MRFRPDVPVFPQSRARVLHMLRDEGVPIGEMVQGIASDPALTGALLLAANSAHSAPEDRVGNIRDAVVRVGMRATREILTGRLLSEAFAIAPHALDVHELWRHVVTVAVLAEESHAAFGHRHDAFTAGLLHDVGRMTLAAQDPGAYADVRLHAASGRPTIDVEREVFGVDHVELGIWVAQQWRLPGPIVQAIAEHHDQGASTLGSIVYAARMEAEALGVGDGVRFRAAARADVVAAHASLATEVDRVCAAISGAPAVARARPRSVGR